MKRTDANWLMALVSGVICLSAAAQVAPNPLAFVSPPVPGLRESPAAPVSRPASLDPKPVPAAPSTSTGTSSVSDVNLGLDSSGIPGLSPRLEAELASFAASLPRSVSEPANDGLLQKAGQLLLPEPVTVRWGRTTLGGGLVTAVQRRNPFGLVNQILFSVSW